MSGRFPLAICHLAIEQRRIFATLIPPKVAFPRLPTPKFTCQGLNLRKTKEQKHQTKSKPTDIVTSYLPWNELSNEMFMNCSLVAFCRLQSKQTSIPRLNLVLCSLSETNLATQKDILHQHKHASDGINIQFNLLIGDTKGAKRRLFSAGNVKVYFLHSLSHSHLAPLP